MADKSRLEQLLERAAKVEAEIAEERTKEAATAALGAIHGAVAAAIEKAVKAAKVDVKVLNGKFFTLTVSETGTLSVSLVNKANGNGGHKATGKANGKGKGNGNGHTYKLADGREFPRIVDAIEALLGKPCILKHDGHTFEDGKPMLRYERLTKDLQAAITVVEKPEAAAAVPPAAAEGEAAK